MRTLLAVCLLAAALPQMAEASQWPVVVTLDGGHRIEGRLLAITTDRLTLSRGGRLEPIPLDTVVRVVKPRDPILDGFLKGLIIGALPFLIAGEVPDGRFAGRYLLTFSAIGTALDAVEGEEVVVYERAVSRAATPRVAPMLGWTVRF